MSIGVWMNDWNNILRDIIYPDDELKSLMCVPEDTSIIEFIDRYFIRAGYTNKVLKDEKVRIVYSDLKGSPTAVPAVTKNEICFDIYVKYDSLHNVGRDRLQLRTQLIADRIAYLLTKEKYLGGYRFWMVGDWDLGTRTTGYARYNVSFGYMKVY